MEKEIVLLMADLSGYTALTESHGALIAADLIDKFRLLISESLVGDCRIHELVGDQVLIVSEKGDDALATAIALCNNASQEESFLQMHIGLHTGKVLLRNNSFFGSAVNVTARILSLASPGSIWCSAEFTNVLGTLKGQRFQSKGSHQLKNLSEPIELMEWLGDPSAKQYIDPVCRMLILKLEQAIAHPDQADIYFCSENCRNRYLAKSE